MPISMQEFVALVAICGGPGVFTGRFESGQLAFPARTPSAVVDDAEAKLAAYRAGTLRPPPAQVGCTKLGLKRAFDELGIWPRVKTTIAANPDAQEEWDLAQDIYRTDPLVVGVQRALDLSDDEVTHIIGRAIELVKPAA